MRKLKVIIILLKCCRVAHRIEHNIELHATGPPMNPPVDPPVTLGVHRWILQP